MGNTVVPFDVIILHLVDYACNLQVTSKELLG
jgi:hypothetical protein